MELLGEVAAWLEPYLREYGVVAVMIVIALESLGAPVPGETMLIAAAVLATRGELSLPALAGAAWAGSVVGDNIGYLIGRKVGRGAILNFGSKIGLTADRLAKVEAVFARYGGATVTFARFFSILRQLNGIVAGTLGMDWRRFLLFNALGAALWVAVWVLGPYYLGEHLAELHQLAHHMGGTAAWAAGALVVLGFAALYLRHSKRSVDSVKE